MPEAVAFHNNPTADDIFRLRIFEEPLVAVGGEPTPDENLHLVAALGDFARNARPSSYSSLEAFLRRHPASPWNVALLTNIGIALYRAGSYTSALTAWQTACRLAPRSIDHAQKSIVDRAFGEFACMLARIGRMNELEEFLDTVVDRKFCGPATEKIAAARAGLAEMKHHPGTSFRCGPLALHRIMLATDPRNARSELIDATESTDRGFSLDQVAELSSRLGLQYQMAFRGEGSDFVVPAVAHLALDHFAALLRREGDQFLLEDPTFKNDTWASAQVLEAECTGYFLVPGGELPPGWRRVESAEAQNVWGRGVVPDPPYPPGPCDLSTDCTPCPNKGMAVAKIHLLNVSLSITDEPIGYSPPVGPKVGFSVRYNQRDQQFVSNFNYSNFGLKWTFDWLAFILDVPSNPLSDVTYYMMGGGNRRFTGFDLETQTYRVQVLDRTRLTRTSPASYEMTAPDGSRKVFSKSDDGVDARRIFLTQVIDPADTAVTIDYDADMRITSITDAIGQTTTLTYGDPGDIFKITSATDPFGRSATFTYTDAKLVSITDAIGIVSQFEYEAGGSDFITTLTTSYGVTRFTKAEDPPEMGNKPNRSLEIEYPDHSRERVEFNQNQNPNNRTGIPDYDPPATVPSGLPTRNQFLYGRNTFYWDRQGCAYGYGDHRKARIYHWLHSADMRSPVGILESFKRPLESRIWYSYPGQTGYDDAFVIGAINTPTRIGRVLDDGSTQLYSYEYNDVGKVTKSIDPVGRTLSYDYAPNGIDLLSVRQTRARQDERMLQVTYNASHRPLTITDLAGQTTTYTYNSRGQTLTETNPLGDTTTYHYDDDGYQTGVTGPLGATDTSTSTYDSAGRIQTTTDAGGYTRAFNYDNLDRLTRITYPDNTFDEITYTLLEPTQFLDRGGRATTFEYNALGQMTKLNDPQGSATQFEWCHCGALRRLADPLGRTTTWRHDIQGRTTSKQYPDGSQIQYRYEDTTSRVRQRIDEKLQITHYTYNRDDSLRGRQYTNTEIPTPAVTVMYDANYLRPISITDGAGTTRFDYYPITPSPVPGAGQLWTITGASTAGPITYAYDELGRHKSIDLEASSTETTFDPGGRVIAETNALGAFAYAYDGHSPRKSRIAYPNEQVIELEYASNSEDRRLQRITSKTGGSTTAEFVYGDYTATAQIGTCEETYYPGTPIRSTYSYDDADQLSSVSVSSAGVLQKVFEYEYDWAGNRTAERIDQSESLFSYNALNQLTSSGGDGDPAVTYAWDAEQRLTSITAGDQTTEFTYDGFGQCTTIRTEQNGLERSHRHFVWAAGQIREERTTVGETTKRFFPQGVKIETGPMAGAYFYTTDHAGSIREVIDANGDIRSRYSYDPFGRRGVLTEDVETDFGFAGMFSLSGSKLNLTRYRAYDSSLGRWLSRDPLRDAEVEQGINLYTYALNDPITKRDPLGLWIPGGDCCQDERRTMWDADEKLRIDTRHNEDLENLANVAAPVACGLAASSAILAAAGPVGWAAIAAVAAVCAAALIAREVALNNLQRTIDLDNLALDRANEKYRGCMRKPCKPPQPDGGDGGGGSGGGGGGLGGSTPCR